MKAPGIRAKKSGTKLRRGAALQVMTYPRSRTKAVIVAAARRLRRPVSSFMVSASLEKAAGILGHKVEDLVPPDELIQYQKYATPSHTRIVRLKRSGRHIDEKRSAAAKRAWITIRAKRARMGLTNISSERPFPANSDEVRSELSEENWQVSRRLALSNGRRRETSQIDLLDCRALSN